MPSIEYEPKEFVKCVRTSYVVDSKIRPYTRAFFPVVIVYNDKMSVCFLLLVVIAIVIIVVFVVFVVIIVVVVVVVVVSFAAAIVVIVVVVFVNVIQHTVHHRRPRFCHKDKQYHFPQCSGHIFLNACEGNLPSEDIMHKIRKS